MGINISASSSLGSFSSQFFFPFFFFFKGNMNLTVFAGILLAVTLATARRASLGEKTMQAAGKVDEPGEAARLASLVEKIMRAADEAEKPDEAKRESAGQNMNKRMKHWPAAIQGASAVADELDEAKRESLAEKKEIKMADEEIEDEAESGEVDDAKSNKVALRQKNDCNNGRCPRCEKKKKNNCKMFYECVDHCKGLQKDENDIAPGIWNTCEEACEHHCICKSEILVGGLRPTHRG